MRKIIKNKNPNKSVQNLSKIVIKSIKNGSWDRFGSRNGTCNAQVGPRRSPVIRPTGLFSIFFAKMSLQGSFLGRPRDPKWLPNRTLVGSRWASVVRCRCFLGAFWPRRSPQGSILGPPEISKWLQNRTFEYRSALGPSKNGLREGVQKKHEKAMNN